MTIITMNVQTGEVTERDMTPDEVAAIPPPPPRNVAAEIAELERQHLMPRAQREFMLSYMEAEAVKVGATQGLTQEQSLALLRAKNSGYSKVKTLDEQIAALRSQM